MLDIVVILAIICNKKSTNSHIMISQKWIIGLNSGILKYSANKKENYVSNILINIKFMTSMADN